MCINKSNQKHIFIKIFYKQSTQKFTINIYDLFAQSTTAYYKSS